MIVLGSGLQLGADLKAARGQGTRGTWVAEQYGCVQHDCSWSGDFFLPNGTEARQHISYLGSLANVHKGSRIPALDTGGGGVYPVNGSRHWVQDTAFVAAGAVGTILNIVYWARVRLRRRRDADEERYS